MDVPVIAGIVRGIVAFAVIGNVDIAETTIRVGGTANAFSAVDVVDAEVEGGLSNLFHVGGKIKGEEEVACRIDPPGPTGTSVSKVGATVCIVGAVEFRSRASVVEDPHAVNDGLGVVDLWRVWSSVENLDEAKAILASCAGAFLGGTNDDGHRLLDTAKGGRVQLIGRTVLAFDLGVGRLGGGDAIHGQGHEEGGDDAELGGSGGELHRDCHMSDCVMGVMTKTVNERELFGVWVSYRDWRIDESFVL